MRADDNIIKSRLLIALPTSLRSALVGHEDANVEQYAKIADSMMAVAASASPFKTVNTVRQGDFKGRRDFNPVNNAADKSFAPRPFYDGQRPKICNSHIFFGEHARSCRRWCKWPGRRPRIVGMGEKTPFPSRPSTPFRTNK